jgi:hypothetical protein
MRKSDIAALQPGAIARIEAGFPLSTIGVYNHTAFMLCCELATMQLGYEKPLCRQ